MNKYVKRKWLRALRSGEYGKGSGKLGIPYENKYCCLGVLACEMVPEFAQAHPTKGKIRVSGKYGYLPDDLAILWGLDTDTQITLSRLNDNNMTFEPVIAYIEKNL